MNEILYEAQTGPLIVFYDGAGIGSPLILLMITGWGIFGHATSDADV